jgi:Zn-dependent protease with chaperone function
MTLYLTAGGLAVLAAVLVGPLSVTLAQATWVARAPRAAVALWQAIGISALIAGIGSGLCVAVERYHAGFVGGMAQLLDGVRDGRPLQGLGLPDALGLTLAADLAIVLAFMLMAVVLQIASHRAHQRYLVDLLAESTVDDVAVLDHPAAVAYCIPGLKARIVISAGAVDLLDPDELQAVVAHERGHAHEAHGLVMLPLVGMRRTIGFIPYARLAPTAVAGLLEMAADDYAARRTDRQKLASALVSMATAGAKPSCGLALTGGSVPLRLERLLREPRNGRSVALGTALLVLGMVAVPLAVLLAP